MKTLTDEEILYELEMGMRTTGDYAPVCTCRSNAPVFKTDAEEDEYLLKLLAPIVSSKPRGRN